MRELAATVLDSFDSLKRLLRERAECYENEIVILDEPLRIVIRRDKIDFFINDEYHGSVGRNFNSLSEEVREEARMWLEGLAMLKFKKFSVKK